MKKSLFLCAAILFCGGVRAQNDRCFRRVVVDAERQPLDYFDLLISDPADSALLRGEACFGGRLELPVQDEGPRIVTLRSLGFRDLSFLEDFARPSSPDTLVMTAAAIGIGDVVVSAAAPAISFAAGKTLVQVAGSSLQHLAEVADILRRTPGLEADESGITVLGKGEPLIYIDDRRSSYAELQLLQPSQIVSIEVDRSPSARYEAAYKAVVRVRTKRPQKKISGQLANSAYFGRRFTDTAGAQLQIASEKWLNYFTYSYSEGTDHNYLNSMNGILLPGSELADTVRSESLLGRRTHSLLYGSTLDLAPRHRLSWQYTGLLRHIELDNFRQEREYRLNAPADSSEAHDLSQIRQPSHTAHLGYRFAVDSARTWTLEADYTHAAPRSTQTVVLSRLPSQSVDRLDIRNRSRSEVVSVQSEFATPLWGGELLVGAHYGRIDSRTFSDFAGSATDTRLSSDNISLYATLGREYPKWGWEAGLRGEFQNDRVRVDGASLREGWENRCFPSLRLYATPELLPGFDFALSYTSRIGRPSVSDLDPSRLYENNLVTECGNPLLRSTLHRSLGFMVSYRQKLTLTADLDFRSDAILRSGMLGDDGTGILFIPLNVDRSRFGTVDLTYSDRWGCFSLTLDAGLEFSHARIPYLDGRITVGRPAWYGSANVDLEIGRNTVLTCGFKYCSRSYELMSGFDPTNNLTAGITQYCFARRLQLTLSGHDLLRGTNDRWHDRYGYYVSTVLTDRDFRFVRFSARWFFNGHKTRYVQAGPSAEAARVN
ncbi:MAG: outer membrane beta-barrel protein [Alistipes sp.]|nr:outer membrane beta-barrel protein [Alistipes sp.]